ncbi:hypothetical protein C7I84_00185 [Mesorhizobium ephedrae]|uniref:Uncharacterized protein n=1 Tax=Kumtagia ephedrae TaxID=2116701 RepID=A0A2P7STV0_9HYPH|nr:hypothetical protein C7I84_00185 [Mesorhizobium ephedrae]
MPVRINSLGHSFPTALLPYCPTALLPYCPTALLPYCPTALLPYCPKSAAAPSCWHAPSCR